MFVNSLRLLSSCSSTVSQLAPRTFNTNACLIKPCNSPRLLKLLQSQQNVLLTRGNAKQSFRRLKPESDPGRFESGYSKLMRPLFFTVGFSCCSFAATAIWQYENFRKFAWSQPSVWVQSTWNRTSTWNSPKQMLSQWWNALSEGQRIALAIICLNGLVLLAWRIPAAQPQMIKWFASNPAAKAICWPMVFSTFSHYTFWHFGINMYVLYSFSTGIVSALGKEQFLALYLSAGVVSSFASYVHKVFTVRPGLSLGASGCLMGILGFFCTQYPNAKLAIIFLPMIPFTADIALKGILIMDGLGVLLGWKLFDHAAHLGGALFGIFYAKWGREYIWAKREPLVRKWDQIRGKRRY